LENLRRVAIFLAVLGVVVSGYLSWSHLANAQPALCSEGGGCDTVQSSRYSEIGEIPVALLGVAGYLAIIGALILEKFSLPLAENAPLLTFGFSLIGVLYSAYLTYLELFVILAICFYCVISALVMVAIFVITIIRLNHQQV
jgi:uncharacterized membrane protein